MNSPMTWQSLFVGREEDMDYLIDVWRCAKQGNAQLLVLLGESGLGKTRLMQEFYRWLTVHEDPPSDDAPQGYWPDAFDNANTSLDVNPRFDSSLHGRGQIPWLWWGVRFLPPEGRNQVGSRCGLSDYRHELFAHTESIGAARRLKELRKAALWTVASDVFGNIIPYVGLVFAAKNLLSMLTGERKREQELLEIASQTPGETAQRGRIELESLALDYFRTILDPRNREAATVPIVLFLDDAQWMDPTTLDFLFQLLQQAIPSNWPLMVACTHWEAEWYLNLRNRQGDDPTPRTLTDIPRLLKLGDDWPGVRQVAPVRDLSPVVAAVLHGVTDEQRDLILRKAGGNPWLLEEILLFLIREPRLFVDRNPERSLTPKGEEEVRHGSFKLHELLADRFAKLNDDVKRTLGWSSEQGTRFLREITVATAHRVDPSLQEGMVLSAMREAENPNRLVQFLGDLSRFNLAEFRQAAFHHVAAKYLAYDPQEQEAVRDALRETLALWLRSGRIDELPEEERLDALLMAQTSLLPAAEADASKWSAWGNAMVGLVSLYRSDFLWRQAWDAACAFADARPEGWPLADVSFGSQVAILDAVMEKWDYRRAGDLARRLCDQTENRVASNDDPETLRELSMSLNRLGAVELAAGRRQEALTAYRRGLEISERIVAEFGETPERLDRVSVSCGNVGAAEFAEGRRDEALAACRRGLETGKRSVSRFGETQVSLRGLSLSLTQIGDVELAQGRLEKALSAYRRGFKVTKRSMATFGNTWETFRHQHASWERIGYVRLLLGRRKEALNAYQRHLKMSEQVLTHRGETPETLCDLHRSLNHVADAELAAGRRQEALAAYRRALEIRERIVARFGETPVSLRDLSVSLNDVGNVDLIEGRRGDALIAYRRGLEIRERIVTRWGETPKSLRDVGEALTRIGDAELAEGRRTDALIAYWRALEISERIVAQFGETLVSLRDLKLSRGRILDLELVEGRLQNALAAYERQRESTEQIVAQFGETPESLRDLTGELHRIGDLHQADGHLAESLAVYRRALEISERIVAEFGETPVSLRDLTVSLNKIGNVELVEGRRDDAVRAYRRGLEISEQLVARFGETPESLRDVAVWLIKLGDIDLHEGRREDALRCYRRSLKIRERILAQFGETPDSLHDVSRSLCSLGNCYCAGRDAEHAVQNVQEAKRLTDEIVASGRATQADRQNLEWMEDFLRRVAQGGCPLPQ